jgi:hypothetical protein
MAASPLIKRLLCPDNTRCDIWTLLEAIREL